MLIRKSNEHCVLKARKLATAYYIVRYVTVFLGTEKVSSSILWFHITQIILLNTFCIVNEIRTFEVSVKEMEYNFNDYLQSIFCSTSEKNRICELVTDPGPVICCVRLFLQKIPLKPLQCRT